MKTLVSYSQIERRKEKLLDAIGKLLPKNLFSKPKFVICSKLYPQL